MEQKNYKSLDYGIVIPEKVTAGYSRILKKGINSLYMNCGKVSLLPGESVGVHSTGEKEELLIVLEGRGVFSVSGKDTVSMSEGDYLYCPPETEHDVTNNGNSLLSYVYVVSSGR